MRRHNEPRQGLRAAGFPSAKVGRAERGAGTPLLSSSGIFCEPVTSVYDRVLAREAQQQQQQQQQQQGQQEQEQRPEETRKPSSPKNGQQLLEGSDPWRRRMSTRLGDPVVPLQMLERMQLVFTLYEWQRRRKRRAVPSFDDANKSEEEMMNNFAAMVRCREQELDMRGVCGEGGAPTHPSGGDAALDGTVARGIPFPVFERFLVEPYFDALFPPPPPPVARSPRAVDSLMDTLSGGRTPSLATKRNSWVFAGRSRTQTRVMYQRRRASHVAAAENLFTVMDTDADGFLSWDEFSSYILQSGQRLLLAGEYDMGAARKKDQSANNVAGRCLNFTPTPLNVNPWQQQFPLVRHLYHSEPISRLIFANRGRRYITAAWDGLVKVWRPDPRLADAHGKPSIVHERTIFAAGAPIIDMVLAPVSLGDAEVLAVVAMDGTVTLLRVGTGEVLKTFIGRCSLPPDAGSHRRLTLSTRARLKESHVKNVIDMPLMEEDIRGTVEGSAVVLRPVFKVRAYRREAIEMFFAEVSRYFTGLGVVAPTYEHLERCRQVKTDVLLHFGDNPGTPRKEKLKPHFAAFASAEDDATEATKDNAEGATARDDFQADTGVPEEAPAAAAAAAAETGEASARASAQAPEVREVQSPSTAFRPSSSPYQRSSGGDSGSNKCWFARSAAFAWYERTSSSSVLPTGVFLLLGFETGVLQFYQLRPQLFTISNLSMTRLELPAMHEPVLTLKLHRGSITSILASASHDLLMTASDDGTVILRHLSRIHAPFLTLGDGVPVPGRPLPLHPSGHSKRVTCICWNSTRGLIVTGGADRIVNFWTTSSSRPLYRIDLRVFSTSSGISGAPVDVSFLQPPRHPLLLLILDTRRTLYFIDTVSYQCLRILRDDGLTSLRAGEMLRARYDAVDGRLILGGRHVRSWDIRQKDEYPDDYCGHRRAVVGLVYQRTFGFWVSADDSVVIIWNAKVVDLYAEHSDSSKQATEVDGDDDAARDRHSIEKLGGNGTRWALGSGVVRSWSVEGGICCLAVDQSELSHVFVALLRERRIVEYNSLSGSVLRSFGFPGDSGDISSLACGVSTGGAALLRPVAFLCGTFEQERSSNGTTALYALVSDTDVLAAAAPMSRVHRVIVTAGVGVSCAVIVTALGLVVVGHRGGISATPADEATSCPIACTRLTEALQQRRPESKFGTPALSEPHLTTSTTTAATTTRPTTTTTITASLEGAAAGEGGTRPGRAHAFVCPVFQPQPQGSEPCRSTPPLDLVALLPGPLLQDPVPLTREYMQQRERYLFRPERRSTTSAGNSAKTTPEILTNAEEEDAEKRNSRSDALPPLLLFSDEFIAASPAFAGSFGLLLREQLAALGYVGHVTPVAETDYAFTGSDDGVLQLWNLRTLSEVLRFRATYALDAVTAVEVGDDAAHLAVGDANGHILLLDLRGIAWDSATPLEMVAGVESGVRVLHRWRGHRQNVTSVQFVRRESGMMRRSTVHSYTVHQGVPARTPLRQAPESEFPAADNSSTREEGAPTRSDGNRATRFLCTSGEDSYVYAWCWEPGPRGRGAVQCIGCFGGGVEAPPTPPLDKLTDSAWQVLEVVRKAYIEERLLSVGGVLSGPNAAGEIHTAVLEIMEEMRAVKDAVVLPQRGAATLGKQPALPPSRLRAQRQSRVQCAGVGGIGAAGEPCPPTYVLAFEEGLYYDRDVVELLERVLTELRAVHKRRQSMMRASMHRASLMGPKRGRRSLVRSAAVSPQEKSLTAEELPRPTIAAGAPDTAPRGVAVAADSATTLPAPTAAASRAPPSVATGTPSLTGVPVSDAQAPLRELPPAADAAKTHVGDAFTFPSSSSSNVLQPALPPIPASQGSLARAPTTASLPTKRPESSLTPINEEDWAQLPPITVHFATPWPLPRLRRAGRAPAEAGASRNTEVDGLPLISDIIGVIRNKSDAVKQRQYGVKVLVREKARRRSFHFVLLSQMQKHLAEQEAIEAKGVNPEQLSLARRERKRRSIAWGTARIMHTLMAWQSPRLSSASSRTLGSASDAGLSRRASGADSARVDPGKLPFFIPLSLGTSQSFMPSSSLKLDQNKSVVVQLKNEMEAMGATLRATLHEKQILMAQERAAASGITTSTRNSLISR
ncbi:uncharacterized protein Tco025E_00966 [Trypanosoma conorhini]|uniref:EF-hand domain-containing protein n=1 Tax=Trypanosoma conorhini TaxID=83891 RepID=A0A3R7LL32_9TRYP|nr:uncharacterized protein Tco025E_00966 [Trypanosoma conorhini]RNF26810.1 hypothetical protein Tco025E_00966 [Trypanosoma conorhini]